MVNNARRGGTEISVPPRLAYLHSVQLRWAPMPAEPLLRYSFLSAERNFVIFFVHKISFSTTARSADPRAPCVSAITPPNPPPNPLDLGIYLPNSHSPFPIMWGWSHLIADYCACMHVFWVPQPLINLIRLTVTFLYDGLRGFPSIHFTSASARHRYEPISRPATPLPPPGCDVASRPYPRATAARTTAHDSPFSIRTHPCEAGELLRPLTREAELSHPCNG